MVKVEATALHGEWKGNGCCCTPGCFRARVGPSMCGDDCICLYPGICGCGPSCPEPCGTPFMRCDMLGENVFATYPQCLDFKDANTVYPLCCGCGTGYVTAPAGAPAVAEMER